MAWESGQCWRGWRVKKKPRFWLLDTKRQRKGVLENYLHSWIHVKLYLNTKGMQERLWIPELSAFTLSFRHPEVGNRYSDMRTILFEICEILLSEDQVKDCNLINISPPLATPI